MEWPLAGSADVPGRRLSTAALGAGVALVLLGGIAAGRWALARRGEPPAALRPGAVVVVEAFSSEGCRSCPPADEYVARLDREQPLDGVSLVVLEEHVDSWDRLGWTDPFGRADVTARQHAYAGVLPDHRTFTPEIVFDGHLQMPGGDEDAARAQMLQAAAEPKARLTLTSDDAHASVDVADVPEHAADDAAEVWLAVTESGLSSEVSAGENAGRRLDHAPVLRRLASLGTIAGTMFHGEAAVDAALSWRPRALRVVAFVQLARSRRIVGAAAVAPAT